MVASRRPCQNLNGGPQFVCDPSDPSHSTRIINPWQVRISGEQLIDQKSGASADWCSIRSFLTIHALGHSRPLENKGALTVNTITSALRERERNRERVCVVQRAGAE